MMINTTEVPDVATLRMLAVMKYVAHRYTPFTFSFERGVESEAYYLTNAGRDRGSERLLLSHKIGKVLEKKWTRGSNKSYVGVRTLYGVLVMLDANVTEKELLIEAATIRDAQRAESEEGEPVILRDARNQQKWCNGCARSVPSKMKDLRLGIGNTGTVLTLCPSCVEKLHELTNPWRYAKDR